METTLNKGILPPANEARPSAPSAKCINNSRTIPLLIMTSVAICGAITGAIAAYGQGYTITSDQPFLWLFARRLAVGGIFLIAEYLMGYFALGEWVVWLAPLLCGMNAGATLVCAGLPMLPSLAGTMVLTVLAANRSGELSSLLLRLVKGDNCVIMAGSAASGYTVSFAAYSAVLIALSLVEGGILMGIA